jgi:hypothetical protein
MAQSNPARGFLPIRETNRDLRRARQLNGSFLGRDKTTGVSKYKGAQRSLLSRRQEPDRKHTMFRKSDDDTCAGGRLRLATLGIGLGFGAMLALAPIGATKAQAGDNPPPGLLAKIQIATQAVNRAPTFRNVRMAPRTSARRVVRSR